MNEAPKDSARLTQKCEICGREGATISHVDHEFDLKVGNKLEVLNVRVPIVECSECDEAYFAEAAEEIKHEAVCAFLGRLAPKAIVALRKSLGMSQAQLAEHTGIGVASIKRWETGALIQSAAMDKQLRELNAHKESSSTKKWSPVFQTVISDSARERARNFSLRPNFGRQLEAA